MHDTTIFCTPEMGRAFLTALKHRDVERLFILLEEYFRANNVAFCEGQRGRTEPKGQKERLH